MTNNTPVSIMKIDSRQGANAARRDSGGAPVPVTVGDGCSYCLDMRTVGDAAQSVAAPRVALRMSTKPTFSATCCGYTFVFTVSADLQMRIAGRRDPDGEWFALGTLVTRLPRPVAEACCVGEFLILRLADGTLQYLVFNTDSLTFTPLGSPPDMPDVSVRRTQIFQLNTDILPAPFPHALTDLRPGIPADAAAAVAKVVKDAADTLEQNARDAGMWTSPALVRVAVRLWDNTLLWLSRPMIAEGMEYTYDERVSLPVTIDGEQFTGSGGATLTRQGWKLTVNISGGTLLRWSTLVRRVEIWVSDCQQLADTERSANVGYVLSQSGRSLNVTLPMRSRQQMAEEMFALPLRLAAVLPVEDAEGEHVISCPAPGVATGQDPLISHRATLRKEAAAICSGTGHLHIACSERNIELPPMPCGVGTQTAECTVAVRISSAGGDRWIVNSGTINTDGRIMPLLWYPSSLATTMIVAITHPDGTLRRREFRLLASQGREDAACMINGNMQPIEIPTVSSLQLPVGAEAPPVANILSTSQRGNPFVTVDSTVTTGHDIRVIATQHVGGGAYTRQFVYLFTREGILAVIHDRDGCHTNLRHVADHCVASVEQICPTDTALMAISDCGNLVKITDARTRVVLRGHPDRCRLAFDQVHGELWLIPTLEGAGKSMVIETESLGERRLAASMRSDVPDVLASSSPSMLFSRRTGGVYTIYEPGDTTSSFQSGSKWVSTPTPMNKSAGKMVHVRAKGRDIDITVTVRGIPRNGSWGESADNPGENGVVLASARYTGDAAGGVDIPLLIPRISYAPGHAPAYVQVTVSGKVPRLEGVILN